MHILQGGSAGVLLQRLGAHSGMAGFLLPLNKAHQKVLRHPSHCFLSFPFIIYPYILLIALSLSPSPSFHACFTLLPLLFLHHHCIHPSYCSLSFSFIIIVYILHIAPSPSPSSSFHACFTLLPLLLLHRHSIHPSLLLLEDQLPHH